MSTKQVGFGINERIARDARWAAFQMAVRNLPLTREEVIRRTEALFAAPIEPPILEESEETETAAHTHQ